MGKGGGAVSEALYEIFLECDNRLLPPLSAIVVQEDNLFDATRRHGMPGGGYLAAEAKSKKLAERRRDSGWERWGNKPRPADTEIWAVKTMIETPSDQNMVWDYPHQWPKEL